MPATAQPESLPLPLKGLDHIVIATSNLPELLRFYCEVLGCTVESAAPAALIVELRAGESLIDLMDVSGEAGFAGSPSRRLDHFCLALTEWDEPAIRDRLERTGATFSGPVTRRGAQGLGPSIYLADPDGNVIELKGPP